MSLPSGHATLEISQHCNAPISFTSTISLPFDPTRVLLPNDDGASMFNLQRDEIEWAYHSSSSSEVDGADGGTDVNSLHAQISNDGSLCLLVCELWINNEDESAEDIDEQAQHEVYLLDMARGGKELCRQFLPTNGRAPICVLNPFASTITEGNSILQEEGRDDIVLALLSCNSLVVRPFKVNENKQIIVSNTASTRFKKPHNEECLRLECAVDGRIVAHFREPPPITPGATLTSTLVVFDALGASSQGGAGLRELGRVHYGVVPRSSTSSGVNCIETFAVSPCGRICATCECIQTDSDSTASAHPPQPVHFIKIFDLTSYHSGSDADTSGQQYAPLTQLQKFEWVEPASAPQRSGRISTFKAMWHPVSFSFIGNDSTRVGCIFASMQQPSVVHYVVFDIVCGRLRFSVGHVRKSPPSAQRTLPCLEIRPGDGCLWSSFFDIKESVKKLEVLQPKF